MAVGHVEVKPFAERLYAASSVARLPRSADQRDVEHFTMRAQ